MKDQDTAIRVENLSKVYKIGQMASYKTLREAIAGASINPLRLLRRSKTDGTLGSNSDRIWALKDVSFEVKKGEVIGIIGPNGSGKSTLLKILSRITTPTEGRVEVHGRVGSLLEVGTGFHPELTGRENVYLNGAILGMTKREIEDKFDEIVDFSGIERFIDTPLKRYSSGMTVRLAFAVAAHFDPEILLVDEVLAVGDAEFQKKCLGKMSNVAKEGRTVLFVSHNMAAIENLCNKCILLYVGKIRRFGLTSEVISYYLENILSRVVAEPISQRKDRSGSGIIKFVDFYIEDSNGHHVNTVQSGKDAYFVFNYESSSNEELKNVDVGFGIFSSDGQLLFVLYSSYLGQKFNLSSRNGQFRCKISKLPLAPGRYRVGARITVNNLEADWPREGIGYFDVVAGDFFGTSSIGFGKTKFLVDGSWKILEGDSNGN